uniref:Nucleoside recognition protein n=1 Tax=Geoglobus ahangari TaxID=113653 RepID=A0A7J3TIJ4_9EURY
MDIRGGLSIVESIRRRGEISDNTIVTYKLVTSPFSAISFLFRYYLPVSLVALGPFAGSIYIALNFIAAVISMVIGLIYGRIRIKYKTQGFKIPEIKDKGKNVIRKSLKFAFEITRRIIVRYTIITAVISALIFLGFFDFLSKEIDVYTRNFGFSSNFAALISIYTFSPISSVLVAGEMLKNGIISVKECLIALLIGRFLFITIMDYPRHSFPFYVSIFPVRLATKLVIAGIIVNAIATPILISVVLMIL